MKTFLKLWNDESGASAAEYALILAIIGSVIAIAALGLGSAIGGRMDAAAECINGGDAASCGGGGSGTGTGTGTGTGSGS